MPVVLVMNVMRLCVRTCCVIRYSWLEVALLCKVIQHPLRGSVYASNVKCAHVCLYIFLVNCFGDEFTSEQSWLGGQHCFDSE